MNNSLETKQINLKVKGKSGFVDANCIQRHRPDCDMIWIELTNSHMLFCQENHPIIVNRNGKEQIIEAKDVEYSDEIWCEPDIQHRSYYIEPVDMVSVHDVYNELKVRVESHYMFSNDDNLQNDIFVGEDKYNMCFSNNVIKNYTNEWFELFFKLISSNIFENYTLNIYSFNLVQQLSHIAYKMGHYIKFTMDVNKCSWNCIFYKNHSYSWDHSISYKPISTIIRHISNYQGYVYDLKTNTGEFLNNGVQTHNSFHCLHKDTKVYIMETFNSYFKEFTLEELWNKYIDTPVKETFNQNGMIQYEKDLSNKFIHTSDIKEIIHGHIYHGYIDGDDDWNSKTDLGTTVVKKIIRHKQDPSSKMVKITTNYGKSLISQDNHPTFFIEPDGDIKEYEPKDLMKKWDYTDYRCLNLKDHILQDGIDNIEYVDNIPDDDYVYDLTTESQRYFANDILTHNTGGAAEFKKIDILKELKSSVPEENESFIDRTFEQKENDLYSNVELIKIVVNKNLYKDEYKIKKENNYYKLILGYFNIFIGENKIRATIEMPVDLFITEDTSETEDEIVILYGKGQKIFNIKFFKIAPEEVAQKIDKLVAGKSPWETPEDLLKKLHDNLSQFGPYDLTHIEVALSNILRNRIDPMVPARMKEPYDPVTFSIKTLPSVLSWSLGIAFENFSKSLTYGLISKDPGNLSSIEKVLYGEPLSDLSKELLKQKK